MKRALSITVCVAFAFLVSVPATNAAELPSESTLPGQRATKRAADLPTESVLPGKPRPANQPMPITLPNEQTLPSGFVVEQPSATPLVVDPDLAIPAESSPSDEPAAQQNGVGPVAIGHAPASQPWLRLNMGGHVGMVRAMTFTRDGLRLCTAGDDKGVEVWATHQPAAAAPVRWIHERTIRWQVARGPRGRIMALAAGPKLLALAGYGAQGASGEIWLVDPATGELKRALVDEQIGHRQVVAALSFAPGDAPILASQDLQGRVLVWRMNAETGLWNAKQLVAPDVEAYGAEVAAKLSPWRRLAPLVMLDAEQVLVPAYVDSITTKTRPDPVPTWRLDRIHIVSGQRTPFRAEQKHLGQITALAASRDGRLVVSADSSGHLFFWNGSQAALASQETQDVPITALALGDDGRTLAAGSGLSPQRAGQAVFQRWDLSDVRKPRLLADEVFARDVRAVAIHPAKHVAFCQGTEVIVRGGDGTTTATLRGWTRPILRIAFAANEPLLRVAIGTRSVNGRVPLERSIDLAALRLDAAAQMRDADWLDDAKWRGDWNVQTIRDATGESHWLMAGRQRVARLPLKTELHGAPSALGWIPDAEGRPFAVAVGTSSQGNIFVFRLTAAETAVVLRQFRGHEGGVRTIGVSRDRRYLVSGGDDATVRIWNLAGFDGGDEMLNRWGATWEVQADRLIATAVREDGPLFFRGVRAGDALREIAWRDSGLIRRADQPAAMQQALGAVSWDTQVVFDFRRRDMIVAGFQMLPAWQPLASLFLAENREWAFWTPAGFYDASFDGHKLFGWQFNRGVDALPEFFLAAQFRKALERPVVMSHLLREGSLEAAFRAAQQPPPGNEADIVTQQYRLKPRIEILAPRPNEQIATDRVAVRARITVRDGLELSSPKVFANGVVASHRRVVQEEVIPGGRAVLYEWQAVLPADSRIMLQVVASTDAEAVESQSIQFQRLTPTARTRRLWVLAAGVNQYRDAQIQSLDFAVNNARQAADALREQSRGLYVADSALLVDDGVTRPMWNLVTAEHAARLRKVAGPDDLLVLFLSGHGVRDEATNAYYFVSADAKFADLKSQRFADCLSFAEFAAFADVPCRKLVVLDTCHGGAVQQPLRQQDLKAALRALQDDVVLTLTASDGSQEAAELKERQLGRFTARFLDALRGAADETRHGGDANGFVTLAETIQFVGQGVAADSVRDRQQQHPTAGPLDLLEFVDVPLSVRP